MSAERFLVHEDLFEGFLEKLVQQLTPIRPLPPTQPDAVLGYLYSERAAWRLQAQIDEAVRTGAREVLHARIEPVEFAGRRWYACAPAVIRDVRPGSRILTEETFGPVFPLQAFQTPEEALAMAEDCPYGLTATVFGPPGAADMLTHKLRASHAIVYTNETMLDGFRPEYWGSGGFKRSGWVWETGPDGTFRVRSGYRPLRGELARIMARVSEEG